MAAPFLPDVTEFIRSQANRPYGFTEYPAPVLTRAEQVAVQRIAQKLRNHAIIIHGGRYMTNVIDHIGDLSKRELALVALLRQRSGAVAHGFCGRLFPEVEAIDLGAFLYAEPGALPQEWHLDSWATFPVVNVVVEGGPQSDFADTVWHDVGAVPEDDQSPAAMRAFKVPSDWSTLRAVGPVGQEGTAVCFWSTTIHRAPAVPPDALDERVTFYCAFTSPGNPRGDNTAEAVFNGQWVLATNDYEPRMSFPSRRKKPSSAPVLTPAKRSASAEGAAILVSARQKVARKGPQGGGDTGFGAV